MRRSSDTTFLSTQLRGAMNISGLNDELSQEPKKDEICARHKGEGESQDSESIETEL